MPFAPFGMAVDFVGVVSMLLELGCPGRFVGNAAGTEISLPRGLLGNKLPHWIGEALLQAQESQMKPKARE